MFEPPLLGDLPAPYFSQMLGRVRAVTRQRDGDVIDLARGNPELPPPAHVVAALREAAQDPQVHGYPSFAGSAELRAAFCRHHEQVFGVQLEPEREVVVVPGTKTGIWLCAAALAGAGERVLVPDPGYADYPPGVALAGAQVTPLPLDAQGAFAPAWDALDAQSLRVARMAFLNYPSNPTGTVAVDGLFEAAIEQAEHHDIAIVHDLAYGELAFEQRARPRSFLETPGAREVGVEMVTMSKTWCMAGWRVGFVCGNEQIVARVRQLLDALAVGVFDAVQRGATAALDGPQDSVAAMRDSYDARARRVYDALGDLVGDGSQGGYYSWVRLPEGITTDELLVEHGVALAPGEGFGARGAHCARLSVSTSDELLDEGLRRLTAALR